MIGALFIVAGLALWALVELTYETVQGPISGPKAIFVTACFVVAAGFLGAGLEHLARLAWAWLA